MKLKQSLLSLSYLMCSVTLSLAQDNPAKSDAANKLPVVEPGHVHDENCNHGDSDTIAQNKPNIVQVRAFLKQHASYILPEFEKVMKGHDEEHIAWMIRDISKIMTEHAELAAFDPKLASLFIEVFKLENDFYAFIETQLEAGAKPEDAGLAAKPKLKALIAKRIDLEKGQIAFRKAKLDKEHKELEKSSKKVDEITNKELQQIIAELKAAKVEPEPEPEPGPDPAAEPKSETKQSEN